MGKTKYIELTMKKWSFLLLLFFAFGCLDNGGNQNDDLAALQAMFEEIQALSDSVACTDSNEWVFTAYGSKACGGPQGYIPYSSQIDVADFLSKVEEYTVAERNYNIRWGIVSTCDVTPQPTDVVCQNGSAVLIY